MNEIALDIQDTQGHVTTVKVAPNTLLEEVAKQAADSLGLPLKDQYGRKLKFALYHSERARFLNLELSVSAYTIRSQDRLRLLPRAFNNLFELELISEPNPGMLFPVAPKETTIGRDFSNAIVIRHRSVSRQHGVFDWQDGFHLYMDLNSANGSWINNQRVTRPTPIADGDILTLGQTVRLVYRERLTGLDPNAEEADQAISYIKTTASRTGLMDIPRALAYLTYSDGQKHLVEPVVNGLGRVGIKVLHDEPDLDTAFAQVDLMIVILSREAVTLPALHEVWEVFLTRRKPIVAVLFEPCRIPDLLEDKVVIVEYTYNETEFIGDLLEALQKVLR